MMDVQCCELQDDEPEYSPEELKEMSQIAVPNSGWRSGRRSCAS